MRFRMGRSTTLLTGFVISFVLIGCGGGKGGSAGDRSNADDSSSTFTFNGKSPEEFYAQFYADVLYCDDVDKSKWLKVAAAVDASTNTQIDLGDGSYISVELYLIERKFRAIIEISEDSNQFGLQGTTVVGSAQVDGETNLSNGKIKLTADSGVLVANVEHGIEIKGEDTIIFQMNDAIQAEVTAEAFEKIGPALNAKMLMKNIKKSLTSAEENIGCSSGVEALVFQ